MCEGLGRTKERGDEGTKERRNEGTRYTISIFFKMKLKSLIIVLIFLSFVHSCIDPIDFSKGDDSTNLVVDGMITNEPGPYVVCLTRSSEYSKHRNISDFVERATVIISDDLGNYEILTETYIPGIYKTDPTGIRGIPGRNYKIEIETPDGKQYESDYELLTAVPEIDSIYYERRQHQELDDNNIVQTFEGFQIYIDTKDPENINNYYMWSWEGTHEVHTQPWDYMDGRIHAPKDCCATCWVTENPGHIDVSDDKFLDGNQINKKPVTFVKIKDNSVARHFRGKYHIKVKQLSLTKEAFNYWSLIGEQISSSGSIFEPPPVPIIGNIENIKNHEEPVFGYFGASAISTKCIFIPEIEAPFQLYDTLIYPDDCRRMGNSTEKKPSFW